MAYSIWLGSEESYDQCMKALVKVEAHVVQHPNACQDDDENEDGIKSHYLTLVDGVGIVSVEGSLCDGTFGIVGKWFGITGYGDIQAALIEAVMHPEVRSIMLNVKSGGGSVNGVSETAALIQNVDKVKPVTTYSPSTMASAALWLGLAGREILAGPTTIVGSIGTLTVVTSRYRQLKEAGIDAVVVRSGKFKALGHPADPMSEEAVADATEKVNYLADMFLGYVADRRGTTAAAADTRFGQGRTFIGEQALAVGLVDAVLSYPDAFMKTKAKGAPDNRSKVFGASATGTGITADNASHSEGNQMANKHIPTAEQLVAMAAGIDLTAAAPTPAAPAASGGDNPEEPDADDSSVNAETAALTAELQTLKAELVAAKAAAEAATAQSTAAQAQIAALSGLADIAKASIRQMTVALNDKSYDVDALEVDKLAATHAEVGGKFVAKFKVGGVAAAKSEQQEPKAQVVQVNPLFLAAANLKQGK